MEDLDLKKWGIDSISVWNPELTYTSISGDELGAIKLPTGPEYHLELNLDSVGFNKLKDALREAPMTENERDLRDINTVHKVLNTEGKTFLEKADNYLKNIDEKVDKMQKEYAQKKIKRYKIVHR